MAGDARVDAAGGEALVAERPSGFRYCLRHHRQVSDVGECCTWADPCGHRPTCDIRRLLIEAPAARGDQ